MANIHEIIEYQELLPMKLFYQRLDHSPMHWHRSLELLFILSGTMRLKIENKEYDLSADDIALINPNQMHETIGDDCVLVILQFRLSMFHLDWIASDKIAFTCISTSDQDQNLFLPLKQIMAKLVQINSSASIHNELLNYTYAFQLMQELVTNFRADISSIHTRPQKNLDRLKRITQYIDEHYVDELTLTSMAEREYLTPSYLSHFFEQNIGVSFSHYLAKVRVEHSFSDLLYSTLSMEEIAERSGFASARAYADFFKKQYNMLPSQYRKSHTTLAKSTSVLEDKTSSNYLKLNKFDFFDLLAKYLTPPLIEQTDSAYVATTVLTAVSVMQSQQTLRHTWRNFCSVGRARELLYGDIQDMLRTIQREIGFKNIKFHGIFDDALNVYRENEYGKPVYDFSYVDRILDFVLSLNLKPMIQLSFMPKALAKDIHNPLFLYEFYISPPKDEQKWYDLVAAFTMHLLLRYGQNEVEQWIFCFWNEALTTFPFSFDSPETMHQLYDLTYRAVKDCDPNLIFGSTSAIHNSYTAPLNRSYYEYTSTHNCEPDLYLFHYYPVEKLPLPDMITTKDSLSSENEDSSYYIMDTDPNAFHKNIQEIQQNLPLQNQKPIYITEWNLSSSHREWLNDTCFSSCYIIKNILENYDKVESFCHWSLSDWIEELPFASQLFHGGMGFFTKNGIKKPAYYAYYFLSKLESTLIESGDSYFITKGHGKYVILLYHYLHFTDLYAQGITFNATSKDRYNAFSTNKSVKYQFTLSDLENGEYSICEHFVNRKYGSALDKWIEMGGEELSTQEELETLKALSHPMSTRSQRQVSAHTFSYATLMEPHEIKLIEISCPLPAKE